MPIYEYRCGQCGHQQEFLQKLGAAPLVECPQCKQPALTKMLSAAGFQLKGSGWYATDFKSKPSGGSAGAKADAKPESKAEGGGESKGGESKSSESKGSESKSSESKSSESKGGESKGSESKGNNQAKSTPPPSSGGSA